jgi:capsular exopolysaccharide synthesis family protein
MREVDDALARAYAQREQNDSPRGVPPAPHWPARAVRPEIVQTSRAITPGAHNELQWPSVVLTLERAWGDRFDKMARLLVDAQERHGKKVFLFTSCHRAEGRTTLVLALARALARGPARTLVLDADLTGPMVARLLGLRPAVGLDDVIENESALSDALIDARDDHLGILPMRSAVSRPRDFLASPAWTCTLARLRREFDVILVDGGPLFTGLSAALLHRSVDAAVLVHHRGMTGERAVLRAREVLEAGGVALLGLAETFV